MDIQTRDQWIRPNDGPTTEPNESMIPYSESGSHLSVVSKTSIKSTGSHRRGFNLKLENRFLIDGRGRRTINICVQCSNARSCSANIRAREHGFEDSNFRTLGNWLTFEHPTFQNSKNSEHCRTLEHECSTFGGP